MSETMELRSVLLPGMLRKGHQVDDRDGLGRGRTYVLTEDPETGSVWFNGHHVPVVYLTGKDAHGYKVMITKVAHLPVDSSREVATYGRPEPVYYRPPEPTFLY